MIEDWILFILCGIGMILSVLLITIEGAKLVDTLIKNLRR